MVQVDVLGLDAGICLKHVCKLMRCLLSLVRTDFQLLKLACNAVRVIFLEQLILFVCGKAGMLKLKIFVSFFCHNLCGFIQVISVHIP